MATYPDLVCAVAIHTNIFLLSEGFVISDFGVNLLKEQKGVGIFLFWLVKIRTGLTRYLWVNLRWE